MIMLLSRTRDCTTRTRSGQLECQIRVWTNHDATSKWHIFSNIVVRATVWAISAINCIREVAQSHRYLASTFNDSDLTPNIVSQRRRNVGSHFHVWQLVVFFSALIRSKLLRGTSPWCCQKSKVFAFGLHFVKYNMDLSSASWLALKRTAFSVTF